MLNRLCLLLLVASPMVAADIGAAIDVRARAVWADVLNGAHSKIKTYDPDLLDLCHSKMKGSPYEEKLCSLIEVVPVPQTEAQRGGITVKTNLSLCVQLQRQLLNFQNLKTQSEGIAAISGAGCLVGIEPSCVLAAAYSLQAAYWQSYIDQTNENISGSCPAVS